MKIWLDDIRNMPDTYDIWVHSVNEAKSIISEIEHKNQVIDLISLDHDLGDYAKDGGDGICLLDWLVERKTFYPVIFHTANPVGRANMQRIKDRYW